VIYVIQCKRLYFITDEKIFHLYVQFVLTQTVV